MLVAAGRGERAGGGVPKQFRSIAGVPLLLRALRPFAEHPAIARIALVLAPDVLNDPPDWLAETRDDRVQHVAGGAGRADSVRAGLAVLPPACALVLVHDAARPFVERALIDRVLEAVRAGDSAIPALPVADTLKRATGDPPRIEATVDRAGLWRAQTPQGFPRDVLEAAHRAAAADGEGSTDDAALVERLGGTVRVIEGSPYNIKLTGPGDFALAELLAKAAPR